MSGKALLVSHYRSQKKHVKDKTTYSSNPNQTLLGIKKNPKHKPQGSYHDSSLNQCQFEGDFHDNSPKQSLHEN